MVYLSLNLGQDIVGPWFNDISTMVQRLNLRNEKNYSSFTLASLG